MTTPATMTAAYVTELGPAEAIRVGELPVPRPGPADVLVRTEALAVNHVDTFVRSGAYRTPVTFPFVIGRDLVGTVVAAGDAVAGFAPGDRVWCNSLGHGGRQGSFAQYALVPSDRLYHLPPGVDPVNAVATAHTAATAYLGLYREARIGLGETLVVWGAGGGVGSAAVQLASASGARVIAATRAEDAQWCRDCGADAVVDYRDPGALAEVARLAPDGVDVFWDNSGRHDLERTVPLLARGGRMVVLAGMGAAPVLPVGALYTRDASLLGFVISNASAAELAAAARAINHGLASGVLRSRIGVRLPLSEAAEAHRLQERGAAAVRGGRTVVLP